MSEIVGILAISLMVVVLLIAAGSLLFVGTLPIARWRDRRRRAHQHD